MRSFRKADGQDEEYLAKRVTQRMSELLRPEDFIQLEVWFYMGRCVVLAMSAWSPVRDPGKVAEAWEAFLSAALMCGFSDVCTDPRSLPMEARWFTHCVCTPIESINGFTAASR